MIDATKFANTCYIVAGGPSLREFDWTLLDGKFVIAINRSYEVLPNAQIVYFTDEDFWLRHKTALLKHSGKLCRGVLPTHKGEKHPLVHHYTLTGQSGLETKPQCLRHGSNSTYAALNLASVHLQFKTIYLLGVDMKWQHEGNKKISHWHDGHKRIDPESVFVKMMRSFGSIVKPLQSLGITVYNVNRNSALNVFPKITIEQAFQIGDSHE
jgi:hypothetical protein